MFFMLVKGGLASTKRPGKKAKRGTRNAGIGLQKHKPTINGNVVPAGRQNGIEPSSPGL